MNELFEADDQTSWNGRTVRTTNVVYCSPSPVEARFGDRRAFCTHLCGLAQRNRAEAIDARTQLKPFAPDTVRRPSDSEGSEWRRSRKVCDAKRITSVCYFSHLLWEEFI